MKAGTGWRCVKESLQAGEPDPSRASPDLPDAGPWLLALLAVDSE